VWTTRYQCLSSFPCCPSFRAQTNQMLCTYFISFELVLHIPIRTPMVYQVFDIPGYVCQTVTSPGFGRHAPVSEGALRKLLWSECCEPTTFNYGDISSAQTASIIQVLCAHGYVALWHVPSSTKW